jgi:hypothetical protein
MIVNILRLKETPQYRNTQISSLILDRFPKRKSIELLLQLTPFPVVHPGFCSDTSTICPKKTRLAQSREWTRFFASLLMVFLGCTFIEPLELERVLVRYIPRVTQDHHEVKLQEALQQTKI